MAYCLPDDLYKYGAIPCGSLASPGRTIDSVSTASDTLSLDSHGFAADTVVRFRAVGGGELPAPLAAGTDYFVIVVDDWSFSVALTAGGAAVNLTSEGTTFVALVSLPVAEAIEAASRFIDDALPAHVIPLEEPVPPVVRYTAAQMAGALLLAGTGAQSESLGGVFDQAQKRLAQWAKGRPIRGENAPATAQLSLSRRARTVPSWQRYGGIA